MDTVRVLYAHAERWERSMLDEDMEAELSTAVDTSGDDEAAEDEMEGGADEPLSREELVSLLEKCQGNVSQVARRAGRNRKQVYRWMDQYALRRGTGR